MIKVFFLGVCGRRGGGNGCRKFGDRGGTNGGAGGGPDDGRCERNEGGCGGGDGGGEKLLLLSFGSGQSFNF